MEAEAVAQAWRVASPAAVHPELDSDGLPVVSASAETTVAELEAGIHAYIGEPLERLTILDYAAGPGRVAALLDGFQKVILVDTNPDYLKIAASLGDFTILQVEAVPHQLPEADVILCVNLFLHLSYKTGKQLLNLFSKTLTPGGLIALHVPIYETAAPPKSWTGVGTWNLDQLYKAAGNARLKVLEATTNPGAYEGVPGPHHARLSFLTHAQ